MAVLRAVPSRVWAAAAALAVVAGLGVSIVLVAGLDAWRGTSGAPPAGVGGFLPQPGSGVVTVPASPPSGGPAPGPGAVAPPTAPPATAPPAGAPPATGVPVGPGPAPAPSAGTGGGSPSTGHPVAPAVRAPTRGPAAERDGAALAQLRREVRRLVRLLAEPLLPHAHHHGNRGHHHAHPADHGRHLGWAHSHHGGR